MTDEVERRIAEGMLKKANRLRMAALTIFHCIKFLLKTGHPIAPAYGEDGLARTAGMFTGMDYKKGQLKDAAGFIDICNHTVDDEPIEYPEALHGPE